MNHHALLRNRRIGILLDEVNLHWEDIRVEGKKGGFLQVTVRESFTPKDKEVRRIPLHDRLRKVLVEYRKIEGNPKTGLVFTTAAGTRYDTHNVGRELNLAGKRAEIEGSATFYVLRHTFASWLAMRGVSLHIIAKFLGHATTQITEMHYAGLVPEDLGDVVARLPS